MISAKMETTAEMGANEEGKKIYTAASFNSLLKPKHLGYSSGNHGDSLVNVILNIQDRTMYFRTIGKELSRSPSCLNLHLENNYPNLGLQLYYY